MQLLKSERFYFIVIIGVLLAVISVTGFKIYQNNEIMLVPRDKAEIVNNCKENIVSCDLIYSSTDEIPE